MTDHDRSRTDAPLNKSTHSYPALSHRFRGAHWSIEVYRALNDSEIALKFDRNIYMLSGLDANRLARLLPVIGACECPSADVLRRVRGILNVATDADVLAFVRDAGDFADAHEAQNEEQQEIIADITARERDKDAQIAALTAQLRAAEERVAELTRENERLRAAIRVGLFEVHNHDNDGECKQVGCTWVDYAVSEIMAAAQPATEERT